MPGKREKDTESISPEITPRKRAPKPAKPRAVMTSEARALRKKVAKPSAPEPVSSADGLLALHGEIERLAYSYWEERGYQGGSPEEDWTRAEQEILTRRRSDS